MVMLFVWLVMGVLCLWLGCEWLVVLSESLFVCVLVGWCEEGFVYVVVLLGW